MTPHERRVFVTLALIDVQLVVLAERSRTRPQRSEATVKTKPPEKALRFLGSRSWWSTSIPSDDAWIPRWPPGAGRYAAWPLLEATVPSGLSCAGAEPTASA